MCKELGVPIAQEKIEGPSTSLVYLGYLLDIIKSQIKIPGGKILRLLEMIENGLSHKNLTLKELQSLTESLQFCAKAMPFARAFIHRMYVSMSNSSHMSYTGYQGRPEKVANLSKWLQWGFIHVRCRVGFFCTIAIVHWQCWEFRLGLWMLLGWSLVVFTVVWSLGKFGYLEGYHLPWNRPNCVSSHALEAAFQRATYSVLHRQHGIPSYFEFKI